MGRLTPRVTEYDLLNKFIVEALELHGQECTISTVLNKVSDLGRDHYYEYNTPESCYILFSDDMNNNKTNSTNSWRKETGSYIEAYLKLPKEFNDLNGAIIDITPLYWNNNSKFIIHSVYSQISSFYVKVHLVPYRESISVDSTSLEDKVNEIDDSQTIIKHKPYLNRREK